MPARTGGPVSIPLDSSGGAPGSDCSSRRSCSTSELKNGAQVWKHCAGLFLGEVGEVCVADGRGNVSEMGLGVVQAAFAGEVARRDWAKVTCSSRPAWS